MSIDALDSSDIGQCSVCDSVPATGVEGSDGDQSGRAQDLLPDRVVGGHQKLQTLSSQQWVQRWQFQ